MDIIAVCSAVVLHAVGSDSGGYLSVFFFYVFCTIYFYNYLQYSFKSTFYISITVQLKTSNAHYTS